jgi:hypothetical protein
MNGRAHSWAARRLGTACFALLTMSCAATVTPSAPATTTAPQSPGVSASATSSAALPSGALPSGALPSGPVPLPDVAWTSITWRKLDPADPLRSLTKVVRGSHSFVAVGAPVATATGSHSPLWSSADGSEWQSLPATAVGADGIVVGLFVVGDLFAALTMVGGDDACQDPTAPCFDTRPPLRAWTSADGIAWSLTAEPLNLHVALGEKSLDPPLSSANDAGVLVVARSADARQAGRTGDGRTWAVIEPDALPPAFAARSMGPVGSGFVATGESDADGLSHVLWSADGRAWQDVPAFGPHAGSVFTARILAVGAGGLYVEGTNDATPGPIWWWSSTDGRTWQTHDDLAPLGVWEGEGAGSGLLPNGELVGDGERMVAYDTVSGTRASTSFDGVTWTDLAIAGDAPRAGGPTSDLTVLPVGLLWRDSAGNAWFGEPATD